MTHFPESRSVRNLWGDEDDNDDDEPWERRLFYFSGLRAANYELLSA